jgi:hypothetical protein
MSSNDEDVKEFQRVYWNHFVKGANDSRDIIYTGYLQFCEDHSYEPRSKRSLFRKLKSISIDDITDEDA